jgi:hypothetical protein
MFKSIRLKTLPHDTDNLIVPPFVLTDSVFTCEGKPPKKTPNGVAREVFVFLEYQKRNLAVAKNLALLYLAYSGDNKYDERLASWVVQDAVTIDYHFPEFKYGIKYSQCIRYQIESLRRR